MSDTLTKIDQLWVRACKSEDPYTRVLSVYKRFYLGGELDKTYITYILSGLCDKYTRPTLTETLADLNPDTILQNIITGDKLTYQERCFRLVIGKLRLSSIDVFPGLSCPARFKQTKTMRKI